MRGAGKVVAVGVGLGVGYIVWRVVRPWLVAGVGITGTVLALTRLLPWLHHHVLAAL